MGYSDAFKEIKTIETDNLVLRKIVPEDANDYDKVINDFEVKRYEGDYGENVEPSKVEFKKTDTLFWINRNLNVFKKRQEIIWGITKKGDNKIIGQVLLHNFKERKHGEISYSLSREFWRQGITTEAVKAIVKYAFEEMELLKLYTKSMKVNTGALKVAKKSGFTEEGLIRKGKFGGIFADYYIFGYLKEEYFSNERGMK